MTKEWLEIADEDLAVAKSLLKKKHYLHCAFMCQQVLEKALKALLAETHDTSPPFTHNLVLLLKECHLKSHLSESDLEMIGFLNTYYIAA